MKRVLVIVFVTVLSFAICLPLRAASSVPFDPPFIDIANQWTVMNPDPGVSVSIVDSTWDSLTRSGTDHIDRNINGIVYSADTVTYEHDPLRELQDITVQFYPTYSMPLDYFGQQQAGAIQYFDCYFLINFYSPDGLHFGDYLTELDYFGVSSGRIIGFIDQMTGQNESIVSNGSNLVNAGYRDANKRSYTVILQVMYLDYSSYQYWSNGAIEFTLRTWDFGIGGSPFDYDIAIDVDIGVIGYSFGYTNQGWLRDQFDPPYIPRPEDIWAGMIPMDPVYIDSSIGLWSTQDIYNMINELDLVTDFFVPIGIVGVTFFSIKAVVWKDV